MEWQSPPADLKLEPLEVHVWQASLDRSVEQITKFREFLSVDERERADRFKFDQHRNRFIVGRGILRSLLAQYLQSDPKVLEFSYGSHGKPFLKSTNLQFNLAHSQDLGLFAITYDYFIGVDIEKIREIKDISALTQRFFSQSECQSIRNQVPVFFRHWTCKEAFLKATGKGLSQIQQLEISIDQIAKLKKLPDQNSIQNWCLKELILKDGFFGAIAVQNFAIPLTFKCFMHK